MGNRKDIGKAFREKLKDFDQSPDDKLWGAIQADLQQKKKRRILPFWFIFSIFGVGFIGGFLVWEQAGRKTDVPQNPAVGQNQSEGANNNDSKGHFTPGNSKGNSENDRNVRNAFSGNNDADRKPASANTPIALTSPGQTDAKKANGGVIKTNEAVTAADAIHKKASKNKSSKSTQNELIKARIDSNRNLENKTQIALQNDASGKIRENPIKKSKKENVKSWAEKQQNHITTTQTLSAQQTDFPAVVAGGSEISNLRNPDGTPTKAIAGNETNPKTDSIPTQNKKTDKKNTIKEVPEKTEKEAQKFSLFVYGSPTFVGYKSGTSPYDRRLNGNATRSTTSLSYGAYAIYEATDTWSLRFGLGMINQQSVTKDAAVDTPNYSGINYTKSSNAGIYAQSNATAMDLIQEVSYLEVPLELKYAIRNGKLGINAFGGLGLRFLGRNEIVAKANGMQFGVGETKDLSRNTFTVNLGVGLDYKFAKRIRLNVEPVFKYHLNDYKNGTVRPYSFGVLTGLQFSMK